MCIHGSKIGTHNISAAIGQLPVVVFGCLALLPLCLSDSLTYEVGVAEEATYYMAGSDAVGNSSGHSTVVH